MNETNKNKSQPPSLGILFKQAIKYQHQGNSAKAESICNFILSRYPDNADTMHLLAVLHHEAGKSEKAVEWITRAIRFGPSNPDFYNTLGMIFKKAGKLGAAYGYYQKALTFKADFPEALYNMAGIHFYNKEYERSLEFYRKALALKPNFPEALNNMAATLNTIKRFKEAIESCTQAIKIKPQYGEAFNNMGNAYLSLGDLDSAIACYKKTITLSGENTEVLCNIANALLEKGLIDESIEIYQKAININPLYGKAYNNLGTALRSKRMLDEAAVQFKTAIRMLPEDYEAYHNLGNIQYDKNDYQAAARWYDKALSINPNSVQTLLNRGIIYQESGRSEKALFCFTTVLKKEPRNPKALCHTLHELYQRCEWQRIDDINKMLDELAQQELHSRKCPTEMPFLSLIRTADPLHNYKIASGWSRELSKKISTQQKALASEYDKCPKEKITVGYLSNNIRNHPTSHLINGIFQLHDRNRFNVHVYSYGENDGSVYRQKIAADCDRFIDIFPASHEDAARQINNDRVDILIDLVGYMRGNRSEICAYRPAPIQVRWLGLAGTTGADFFDYLITDRITTPDDQSPFYSEKFIFMPDTYQVNSPPLKKSKTNFIRNDFGLSDNTFVYCCFCSNYKIEPVMFRIWMDILTNVPNSLLWLFKGQSSVEENLGKEAERYGVDPRRLVFGERMPKEDHLQRISLADLALDTKIVNGAATTSDALYAGVPVLTIKGTHFASRMSASILSAVGIDETVVETVDAYRKRAIEYGTTPLKLRKIREQLHLNRFEKPLFDTQRFVRNLELAYLTIWQRYQNGARPQMLDVVE